MNLIFGIRLCEIAEIQKSKAEIKKQTEVFMLGYQELIIVLLIVVLLFGGSKIPDLARGLGKGIREFKKAKEGIRDAIEKE